MEYRGNKRPHSEELDSLRDKYERIWDELDIAFQDISKLKNDMKHIQESNLYLSTALTKATINYSANKTSLEKLESAFMSFKSESTYDIHVNHANINFVSARLIFIVVIFIAYALFYKYKDYLGYV